MHELKALFLTTLALSLAFVGSSSGHRDPGAVGELLRKAPPIERKEILSRNDATAFTIRDRKIFAEMNVLNDSQELKFLAPEGNQYKLLHKMKSEPGEAFEIPVLFESGGEAYFYVSTTPSGSSGFVTESIYWIAPDSSLHPIGFEQAGQVFESLVQDGDIVLTGGPGIVFSDQGLQFEFAIARAEDPHCCPTGGTVTGFYRIDGEKKYDPATKQYTCTFNIVPDVFQQDTSTDLADAQ